MTAIPAPDQRDVRRYAMQRVAAGDWLCASNDERTLYRFQSYPDGADLGLDVNYRTRNFWRVLSTPMPATGLIDVDEIDGWGWSEEATAHPSRRHALASVWRERGCPDGGRCHHGCLRTEACCRVSCCAPLSGVFPNDAWPAGVR